MGEIIAVILAVALETGVDGSLAVAVARAENGAFEPEKTGAVNANGTVDMGIMQLNSRYLDYFVAEYWDGPEAFDWSRREHNIYVGLRHLKHLLDAAGGDVFTALLMYNAGEENVRRGTVKESSVKYAEKVYAAWLRQRTGKHGGAK
jgi:soluble lytic murein transglycosylase-like protein